LSYFPLYLTADLRRQLQDFGLEFDQAKELVEIETLILGAGLLDSKIKIEEIWSVLIGYNYPIVPNNTDQKLLMRLRLFFPQYRNESNWQDALRSYSNIDKRYRLYQIKEDFLVKNEPQIAGERQYLYEKVLEERLARKKSDSQYASEGVFTYKRIIDTELKFFQGKLPKLSTGSALLPKTREKIKPKFDLLIDWESVAKEMDLKSNKSYVERIKRMSFQSINSNEGTFYFDKTQHIVGGLGSGKSTWMVLQTYYHVTRNKVKVGFIENSVSQVLERVEELRSLGLNAVPLIGKAMRSIHEERFLSSNTNDEENINQFSDEKFRSLTFLSDCCTIKALVNDFERNNKYPCKAIEQDYYSYLCPLANTCGVYRNWTELPEADVWVATTASLIETKMPTVVDTFERTVYEAMYDLLDLIFVDEADAVQQQLDQSFLVENIAFGKQDGLIENLLKLETEKLTGRYNDFAEDKLLSKWRENLSEIKRTTWPLFEKLKLNPDLSRLLNNQLLFPRKEAFHIAKRLAKGEDLQKKIEAILSQFAWNPSENIELYEQFQLLLSQNRNNNRQEIINQIVKGILQVEKEVNEKVADQLELYFYFAYLDYHIRFLISYLPAIQSRLGIGFDFSALLTKASIYKPFLLDAMTGTFLGYRYEQPDKEKLGYFKLIKYSGIGRKLLFDWHHIYEHAFGIEGPAIIALSGTSLAPGSNHYHLEVEPKWIIKTKQHRPILIQKYLPVINHTTGKSVKISGQPLNKRNQNFEKLLQGLKEYIQYERKYMQKENRRVLLVVNSYDDVVKVANLLETIPDLRDHYRYLTRTNESNKKSYSRFLIENFVEEKEEILIVPLMSVSRAYNILNRNGKALFGTIFFLVRPYPVPNDLSYMIQILHANYFLYLKDIHQENLTYGKAVKSLRKRSIRLIEYMYTKADFWSTLNTRERETLSWYIFIPIWQIIGRLIRGGSHARIFYCDGSFHSKDFDVPSLLEFWKDGMAKYKNNSIMDELYGPFIDSIKNLFDDNSGDEE